MNRKLDRAPLPDTSDFREVSVTGLSSLYPVRETAPDIEGFLFRPAYPPSYQSFGRMRTLLTARYATSLRPKRVLEVAAGGGGLSATLAEAGATVVSNDIRGSELSASLASHFTRGGDVEVVAGNIFDVNPDECGQFDLVIAAEVLEHVAYPGALLGHLKRFLGPGGRLLVTTPCGTFLRNKLPTYRQIEDPETLVGNQFRPDADGHLFLLTPQEIVSLASEAGLRLVHLSVWGTPLLGGGFRLQRFSSPAWLRLATAGERLAQRLPESLRERVCCSVLALLGPDGP